MVAFLEFLTNFYLVAGAARLENLLDKVLVVKSSIATKTAIFGTRCLLGLSIIRNQFLARIKTFHVAFIISDRKSLTNHPLLALGILGRVDVLSPRGSPVILQSLIQLLNRPSCLLHAAG